MTQTQNIRRHDDGSINFDFYRAHAAQLRREQRSEIVRSLLRLIVKRALALMSRVDQRCRAELAAAR